MSALKPFMEAHQAAIYFVAVIAAVAMARDTGREKQ